MNAQHDATKAQVRAARPDASTWLAANAGSGKTRVLTDRVARLLLEGVEPQNILCLTYTKAAASEMQNRLFERLGAWAMLEDTDLHTALGEMGAGKGFDTAQLRMARTLFARAIETPGGLKIQTIHSFCAALLRRFPLEAEVSPQFTEIEDRAADLLRAEIVDQMAAGPETALITDLAQYASGDDFDALTRDIVRHRSGFSCPLTLEQALGLFGQPADLSMDAIATEVFLGTEQDLLNQMIPPMLAKGGNDEKAARKLGSCGALGFEALGTLEEVFLTGKGAKLPFSAKIGSFPTKSTRESLQPIMPAIEAWMQRVEDARDARLALLAAQKTAALHAFAARFLPLYDAAKTARGWLDFDDLIEKARGLLNDESVAAWVLFRIDGGIDHILVDEAQDTSPAQWDVIRKLAAEFTSGKGANDRERTLFVVGDKKQSIYSFQGADPDEFDRMESEFGEKLRAAELTFQSETLRYSFRSATAVLSAVDATLGEETAAGFAVEAKHIAFKSALPGRVDLWDWIESQPKPDDVPWYQPLDILNPTHHTVILAQQIADRIRWMIDPVNGQTVPDEVDKTLVRRPVQPGDFLILVQRRSALFAEIIRACKASGLDIAGADRLKVGGELAVRDLGALLAFLATPEDCLSLASALKSPLFGWSEQQLFDLAHHRGDQTLWQALRGQADACPETYAILRDLRDNTDFLRPYDLIERILIRHGGRRKLLARLGTEAEDGINALLSQALAYERNTVPSLTGFLVWMETDDLEIKRQMDSASNQIRVMTVHGAKGLEAPIVILPDSGPRNVTIRDDIVVAQGKPVWKTSAEETPTVLAGVFESLKQKETEERLRLLYVAMTRAEKWLIVAAAGDSPKERRTWYHMIEDALETLGAKRVEEHGHSLRRWSSGAWDTLPFLPAKTSGSASAELEDFFKCSAAPPSPPQDTIKPSDLGGAKALPGETGRDEEDAKSYGTLVHRLLEHLPAADQGDRPALATVLSEDHPDAVQAYREAITVLEAPALRDLFDADALCEVELTADLGSRRIRGTVDRLLVNDKRVLAVDFKTNRTIPATPEACPDGILRQMGAYAQALATIFPHHRIETAIVWTSTCEMMPLSHEIVMSALADTPYLDDSAGAA